MSSKVELHCAKLATFTLSIGYKDENFSQDIPDELIEVGILPRLDVKTLHKFKCVSKRYESLISHPKFELGYTQKAYSSLESLSSSGLRSTMLFPFTDLSPFAEESGDTLSKKIKDLAEEDQGVLPIVSVNSISLPDLMGHLIVASTSGLVLSRYYDYPLLRDSFTTLWVSNPLTQQSIKLPPNKLVTPNRNKEYGFASRRDQSTDLLTYKVVVFGFPVKKVVPVNIFSSETGRWVSLEVPLPQWIFCVPYNGFSHKGCLYYYSWTQGYVLTYNPYDSPDRFDSISLPPDSDSDRTSLVHSDSAVRCWEMIECDDGVAVTVWRLEDAMAKPWWCFERRFQLPSLAPVCNTCMVALYPWDQDVICLSYLEGTKMAIINQRRGTWESVDVTYYLLEHNVPLINIHLTPWSSPFYAKLAKQKIDK